MRWRGKDGKEGKMDRCGAGLGLRQGGMKFVKVKGMHEVGVIVNIFVPVIREPASNQHNGVRGETA